MKESMRLSTSVIWSFVALSINALVALFISILLGRLLGPSDLGAYRLTRTFTYLLAVFIGLGVPSATTKYIAENVDNPLLRDSHFTASLLLSSVIGSSFTIIMFAFAPSIASLFQNGELSALLQLISPYLVLFFVNSTMQSFLVGTRRMKWFSLSIILENASMAVLTTSLVILGWGAQGAVLALVGAASINMLYLTHATQMRSRLIFHGIIRRIKTQLGFGLNILMSTAVNQVNYRADVIALGYFKDNESVGFYSVGITLGNFFFLLPSAIQKVTYPATAEYWGKRRKKKLQVLLNRSTRYTTAILLFFALPFLLLAKDIVFLLYGREFAPAVVVLQIIVVGIVVNGGLSYSVGGTLPAIGRPDLAAQISALSALLNVILLVLFIPMLGLMGAALATALSLMLRGGLGLYFNFKLTGTTIPACWFLKALFLSTLVVGFHAFLASMGWNGGMMTKALFVIVHSVMIWQVYLSKEDRRFLTSLGRAFLSMVQENLTAKKSF